MKYIYIYLFVQSLIIGYLFGCYNRLWDRTERVAIEIAKFEECLQSTVHEDIEQPVIVLQWSL